MRKQNLKNTKVGLLILNDAKIVAQHVGDMQQGVTVGSATQNFLKKKKVSNSPEYPLFQSLLKKEKKIWKTMQKQLLEVQRESYQFIHFAIIFYVKLKDLTNSLELFEKEKISVARIIIRHGQEVFKI